MKLIRRSNRISNLKFSSTATEARPEPQVASKLTDIGTRRLFGHEHDMFREMLRKFYADNLIPFHDKWEEQGHVPRELWKQVLMLTKCIYTGFTF